MTQRIAIPAVLREHTDGAAEIAVQAGTVGEALGELTRRHPRLRRHLFRDDGTLRSFVNVYVNEEEARRLGGTAAPLAERDTVTILPSIAGG